MSTTEGVDCLRAWVGTGEYQVLEGMQRSEQRTFVEMWSQNFKSRDETELETEWSGGKHRSYIVCLVSVGFRDTIESSQFPPQW